MADINIVPVGQEEPDLALFGQVTKSIVASDPDKSVTETVKELIDAVRLRRDMQLAAGEDPSVVVGYPITEKDRHPADVSGEVFQKNGYFEKHNLKVVCDKEGNISVNILNSENTPTVRLGSIPADQTEMAYNPGSLDRLENDYLAVGAVNAAGAKDNMMTAFERAQALLKDDQEVTGIKSYFTVPTGLVESLTVNCAVHSVEETASVREQKAAIREQYAKLAAEVEDNHKTMMQVPQFMENSQNVRENTAFLGYIDKEDGSYHTLHNSRMDGLIDKIRRRENITEILENNLRSNVMLCFRLPDGQNGLLTYEQIQEMNSRGEYSADPVAQDKIQKQLDAAVKDLADRIGKEVVRMDSEKEGLLTQYPQLKEGFTHTCEVVAYPDFENEMSIPLSIKGVDTYTIKSSAETPNRIEVYCSPVYDFLGHEDVKKLADAVLENKENIHTIAALGNRLGPKVYIPEEKVTVRLNPEDAKSIDEIHKKPFEKVISLFTGKKEKATPDAGEERLRKAVSKGGLGDALNERGKVVEAVLQYMSNVDSRLPEGAKLMSIQQRAMELKYEDNLRGLNGNDIKRMSDASKEALEAYKYALSEHKDIFLSEAEVLKDRITDICNATNCVMFIDIAGEDNKMRTAMLSRDKITLIQDGNEIRLKAGEFAELFASSLTAQRITTTVEQQRLLNDMQKTPGSDTKNMNIAGIKEVKTVSLEETVNLAREKAAKAVKDTVNKIKSDQKRER